jgi:hypothetical protein
MRVVLDLTEGQIADICAQLLPKAKPAAKRKARPMTEHRRTYQRELMRKRRAAAKDAA